MTSQRSPWMQVLHQTDHNKPAWDGLAWAVRTGGRPFERAHDGLDQFAWLKAHPAEEDKFSRAMSEIDALGALVQPLLPINLCLFLACSLLSPQTGGSLDGVQLLPGAGRVLRGVPA